MKIVPRTIIALAPLLPLGGCVLVRHQLLLKIQAQEETNARLTLLAAVCIVALPIALWAGLLWGTKTITLQSWWILLTIECVLLAVFASLRSFL